MQCLNPSNNNCWRSCSASSPSLTRWRRCRTPSNQPVPPRLMEQPIRLGRRALEALGVGPGTRRDGSPDCQRRSATMDLQGSAGLSSPSASWSSIFSHQHFLPMMPEWHTSSLSSPEEPRSGERQPGGTIDRASTPPITSWPNSRECLTARHPVRRQGESWCDSVRERHRCLTGQKSGSAQGFFLLMREFFLSTAFSEGVLGQGPLKAALWQSCIVKYAIHIKLNGITKLYNTFYPEKSVCTSPCLSLFPTSLSQTPFPWSYP